MATNEYKDTKKLIGDPLSRFRKARIYRTDDGRDFFETYRIRDLPESRGDFYHEVDAGEEGRLDLVSFLYYGTPALWWVIADANDIFFPMRDVVAGQVLRIPNIESLYVS